MRDEPDGAGSEDLVVAGPQVAAHMSEQQAIISELRACGKQSLPKAELLSTPNFQALIVRLGTAQDELRELLKLLLVAPSLGRDVHAGGGFLTLAPYDGRDEQDADARAAALDNFARRCAVDEPLAMLCTEDEDVSFAPLRAIDLNVN